MRPSVLMATPLATKSSRNESDAGVSTGIQAPSYSRATLALIVLGLLRRGIVHYYRGVWPQCAQGFVASCDDFVLFLESLGYFNVCDTADACFHRHKEGFAFADNENALDLLFLGIGAWGRGRSSQSHAPVRFAGLLRSLFQVFARAHSKSLDRYGQDTLAFGGADLGGCGKARPQTVRRIVERHHHLEVLSLLSARGRLGCRQTGAAQNRLRSDFGNVTLERLARHGV